MRRLLQAFLVLALGAGLALAAVAQSLVPVPPLQGRVNDLTGTLTPAQRQSLESRLQALEQRKGSQLVILIVPTTQPEPIEAFSIRVAEAWKIGRASVNGERVDDGVLLVVARNDRRVRIEVGYGLEGAIPDAYARRIIAEAIAPRFREGDYAGGLSAAVDDLSRLIEGEPLPAPWTDSASKKPQGGLGTDWVALLLFAFVVGLVVRQIFGRLLGSALGGALGGGAAWIGGAPLLLAGFGGAFLFLVLLSLFSTGGGPMGRVGRHTWRSGPGGFPGGFGGGGGFRSGGGGFSGGGGGFGGGGASGGW